MAETPSPPSSSTAPYPLMKIQSFWGSLSGNAQGAVCVLIGEILLVLTAALAKELGDNLPALEIVFGRCLAGLLAILPVMLRMGRKCLETKTLPLHIMRSFYGFMGNCCLIWSVIYLTLADAITIQFSRPLIMIVIAVLVLREVVGLPRAIATGLGFGGVLMVMRPFGEGFDPWALVAVAGAFFASMVVMTVKKLGRTEGTMVIMTYYAIFTTLFSAIPVLFVWVTPTPWQLLLLALTGAFGIAGQAIFTHGITLGETSFLMPFDYLRIVYSFILGLVWFGEVPGFWSYAGAAVIIASSIYLLRTESSGPKGKKPIDDKA